MISNLTCLFQLKINLSHKYFIFLSLLTPAGDVTVKNIHITQERRGPLPFKTIACSIEQTHVLTHAHMNKGITTPPSLDITESLLECYPE